MPHWHPASLGEDECAQRGGFHAGKRSAQELLQTLALHFWRQTLAYQLVPLSWIVTAMASGPVEAQHIR